MCGQTVAELYSHSAALCAGRQSGLLCSAAQHAEPVAACPHTLLTVTQCRHVYVTWVQEKVHKADVGFASAAAQVGGVCSAAFR